MISWFHVEFPKRNLKDYGFISLSVVILFVIFVGAYFAGGGFKKNFMSCGDGTFYSSCSQNQPYYCENGIIIEKASVCGCPESLKVQGEYCISDYQKGAKNITLNYTIRGEEREITFVVYKSVADYISEISRGIHYSDDEKPSRRDFKIKSIEEKNQRASLLPLVVAIQNSAHDKEEQARIAISVVQNIPFGNSDKKDSFGGIEMNHSRYPYEVLYELQGVCGEKSDLLAFLLKELGYGVVIFYYSLENHEAVGIKCPERYSLENSGYCFTETTGPAILTDSEIEYVGVGKMLSSPEIFLISDGDALRSNLYEYADARDMRGIRRSAEKFRLISFFQDKRLEEIRKKYGLVEEYHAG